MIEEQAPQAERGKQLEILDLKNHRALYGRFLLASQAGTPEEAANMINPENATITFSDLTEESLKNRNYNLVAEKPSIAERKKEWGTTPFDDAYSQWRTEFKGFMTEIKDSNLESALMIIMLNPKNAKDFTEDDADQLFTDFCKNGSNITNFIERVKTNLVSDGKINPTSLQELLPHLQWIASGLFGKNTASIAVTRLIELESAIYNNSKQVVDFFNLDENKKRINAPTDDEKKILGFLYDSLPIPQERVAGPTQVVTVIVPAVPKPAPVDTTAPVPGSEEDKDKPPPAPPTVNTPKPETTERVEASKGVVSSAVPDPEKTTAGENPTDMTGTESADFPKKLNELLTQNKNEPHLTLSFLPDQLREYIISVEQDFRIEGGSIKEGKNNQITISNLRITKLGVGVTLDLALSNDRDGIAAKITKFHRDFMARGNKASSREEVEKQIKAINSAIKKGVNKMLYTDNASLWSEENASIAEGKFLITFGKRLFSAP